jgi:hypothetical protein
MAHWQFRHRRQLNSNPFNRDKRMDYKAIFEKETNDLVSKGFLPAEGRTQEDNDRIVIELRDRIKLMESAIEELRIRRHADEKAIAEHTAQLPKHRQAEIAERDMADKQKKHQDKLDRQVQVRKANAIQLQKALRAAMYTEEEIVAELRKKDLI